jgi:phospholipid/cholesterol/gamma-HCH transport system ATP-binding protein
MGIGAPDPIIDLKDVRFGYAERPILDGLNLTVPKGQILAVMGGSGSGKTSLLGLLGGRNKAWSGQVRVDGQDVGHLNRSHLYALRQRLGMLFQFGALFTDLTVFENVAFPYREQTDLPEAIIRDLVLMKLEAVGLRGAAPLMPSELSGGMARRVALARAIALDPMLMMYDEPFTGLDPISVGIIGRLIQRLNATFGMTSLIVTHDLNETLRIADRVVVISEGKVYRDMTPQDVRKSDDLFIRQFADGLPDGPVPFHYPAPPYAQQLIADHVSSS